MNKKGIILAVLLVAAALFIFLFTAKEETVINKAALGKPAPPFELKDLFDRDLAGLPLPDTPTAQIYSVNFCHLAAPMKRKLYGRFFGN